MIIRTLSGQCSCGNINAEHLTRLIFLAGLSGLDIDHCQGDLESGDLDDLALMLKAEEVREDTQAQAVESQDSALANTCSDFEFLKDEIKSHATDEEHITILPT